MEQGNNNLIKFINEERAYFNSLKTGINWDDNKWNVQNWLFHRGSDFALLFNTLSPSQIKISATSSPLPSKRPLPYPMSGFVKAMAVYAQRTRGVGYIAVRNYINECRRIFIFMHDRSEVSPTQLTRWHFEKTIDFLKESGYKNMYDASANLKIIADLIDKKKLTPFLIDFNPGITPARSYHDYKSVKDIEDDTVLAGGDKMPSYEAMQAYALCTNNPINENEEILLRTIDLLIAMGQRGNEVALIPYDCWVERKIKDKKGNFVKDKHGVDIKKVGIRYYAEKKFTSRVHWFAEQDIQFAKRAVDRLIVLTKDVRKTAKWQEENPNRLWEFLPGQIVEDIDILKYLGFENTYNLYLYLKDRNNISPVKKDDSIRRVLQGDVKRKFSAHFYRAGDIEKLLLPKLNNHIALKEKVDEKWSVILRTSEILSIRFDGAYRFKREANTFYVLPCRTKLVEINTALGAFPNNESIFVRRNLKEADGSPITLTSHQPRHWRNTLYELAGMSDVQQALAMGRQRLDLNPTYQHTSLRQKTKFHKDYIAFINPSEKVNFLRENIRNKQIAGDITETYHSIKNTKGIDKAESFLHTHALGLHLTPFGGCTHDFSQAPCPKYLQCWDGCSHLHRTNTPGEAERIKEQIILSKRSLANMKKDATGEYGADVWIAGIEKKIANMERSLLVAIDTNPVTVFPEGKPVTIDNNNKRTNAV
ncbi:MAG: hypothetical protein JNK08_09260 [Sediminibacterium sp.]|nr:hypothetical protein [Sediminibacterium sp.]